MLVSQKHRSISQTINQHTRTTKERVLLVGTSYWLTQNAHLVLIFIVVGREGSDKMENIPKKIYVQIGQNCPEDADYIELQGTSFSTERIHNNDIVYELKDKECQNCENCKFCTFLGLVGDFCLAHDNEIRTMFPNHKLKLCDIGCLHFKSKGDK